MKTFIIAEAGVNHNGSIDIAKKLIDVAANAKADAVKFQTFKASSLVLLSAKSADYQKRNFNTDTQFEMLKKLELSKSDHETLFEYCHRKGIEFLSTPFDLDSLNLLEEIGLKKYKIPSGEITNLPLLRAIGKINKPVILSTGMSNNTEVSDALEILYSTHLPKNKITILHANTEYPTPMKDVHLKAMVKMGQDFDLDYGYSDHTLGIEVDIAAVALGASVIEKHFTLSRDLKGPDHQASLEPEELCLMVRSIRNIESALGQSEKRVSESERKNLPITRKSIVAKKTIKIGDTFSEDNLCTKRPGTGLSPMTWDSIIGTTSKKNYSIDEVI